MANEIIKGTRHRYKDLDLNFIPHPSTGDIVKKYDAEAIKRSVRSLILTKYYDRLFQPLIGSNVPTMLFENATPITATLLKKSIEDTINTFEKRVELIGVDVKDNSNDYEYVINIRFNISNDPSPISVDFVLKRTR